MREGRSSPQADAFSANQPYLCLNKHADRYFLFGAGSVNAAYLRVSPDALTSRSQVLFWERA
jgi:hypothetical protein